MSQHHCQYTSVKLSLAHAIPISEHDRCGLSFPHLYGCHLKAKLWTRDGMVERRTANPFSYERMFITKRDIRRDVTASSRI